MFNLVRKIVAGPKNRTVFDQYDLDLTYITDRIIAMAFPASGLQKAYRNSIDDVAKFLKQRHGNNYLVINASNRKYEYAKFNNQVEQFFWTDHQAPPLTTLFQLCEMILCFLEENQHNVVAVHCNHGKGRTGTAIIAYLLYSGEFDDFKAALKFYNKRRFLGSKYGVDQPCQLRYLNYFKSFLQLPLDFIQKPLKAFRLTKIHLKGLKQKQLFLRISETRTQQMIYPSVCLSQGEMKFVRPLMGDIFIQLFQHNWSGTKQLLRINFHMVFLEKNQETNVFKVIFMADQIKTKNNLQIFELILEFQEFCHCHQSIYPEKQCLCYAKREMQEKYWQNMIKMIIRNRNRKSKQPVKIDSNLIKQQVIRDIQPQYVQKL